MLMIVLFLVISSFNGFDYYGCNLTFRFRIASLGSDLGAASEFRVPGSWFVQALTASRFRI